jgi:hypothetical protein
MTEPYEPESQARQELRDPHNPPNSMLRRETRRAALMSYLGPVVVFFVVVGIALIYWANRQPPTVDPTIEGSVATTGSSDGGRDPEPRFDDTRDELDNRGGDAARADRSSGSNDDVIGTLKAVTGSEAGRRVALKNVEVSSVESDQIWVHDGNNRIAITVPENASAVVARNHVDVDGFTETDSRGIVRIRATRIHAR